MKRLISATAVIALALFLAAIAVAQYTGRLDGQVLDFQGKPYPDVTVQLKNLDTGQTYTLKTGKDGRFVQLGMKGGQYDVTITNEKDKLNYTDTNIPIKEADQNPPLILNLKEIAAKQAIANPDEIKKREDEENKFKNMQSHFNAGIAAMNTASDLKTQLRGAAADQKASLQEKRTAACQTAVTEFQTAEQGIGPKDVTNHSTVWTNLGAAYECAGRSEDAAAAFQKSIDLKPTPGAYRSLSTNLATLAVAETDPKAMQAKLADAGAACDKAIALDPTTAAPCWKNIGIVMINGNRHSDAVAPLQKATQADPKDPQSWLLLGRALSAMITSKQEGGKEVFVIPPGTAEAYQKCIDLAPSGPFAADAKQALDELALFGGGVDTKISKGKNKK